MNGAARDIAALAAAVGVVGLIAPLPLLRSEAQRAAALAVTLAAWALLLASLIPGDDARKAFDRFTSPTGAVAGVVAVIVLVAALIIGVRVILGWPLVWFVLLGLAMPIRIPVTIGKTDGNLLVPLYAVILLGLAAWIWGRLRGRITARADEGPPVLTWPLAAFVGFLLVSSLWSADTAEAAKKAVFFYIPFVLLYALTVAWWPRARALGALAVTTILGATVAAVAGLWQYTTEDIWWNQTLHQANVYSRFFRVNGIFFDPNILGRYLVVGLLVCVALAWVRRRPLELGLLAAAAVVMTAGLVVTFSRSSALMLMVGLVLLATRAFGPKRALITGFVPARRGRDDRVRDQRQRAPRPHRLPSPRAGERGTLRPDEGRPDHLAGPAGHRRRAGWLPDPLRGDADPGRAAAGARGDLPQQPDHRAQRGRRDRLRAVPGADRGRRLGDGARVARPGRCRVGALDPRHDRGRDPGAQPAVRRLLRGSVRVGRRRRRGGAGARGATRARGGDGDPRRGGPMTAGLRVLCLSNMWPGPADPDYGAFVADMCGALEGLGMSVDPVVIDHRRSGRARTPVKYGSLAARAARHARRADVIYAHYLFPTAAAASLAARTARIPFVVTAHGQDVRNLERDTVRRATAGALRGASALIAVSRHLADDLRATGMRLPPVHVVNMGVDMERFVPRDRSAARARPSACPATRPS